MSARRATGLLVVTAFVAMAWVAAHAQATTKPFEPTVGQAGKDVVWVPTPQALVEKMLDLAKVTPQDFVMDLGSGDGRTVITAAKRGAQAQGIEYNPDMVELSKKNAAAAGVTGKANFVQGRPLRDRLLEGEGHHDVPAAVDQHAPASDRSSKMRPGTRIVSNTFTMEDWEPDRARRSAATAPAGARRTCGSCRRKVQGTWQAGQNALTLTQKFQKLDGTLGSTAITERQAARR